MYWIVMMWWRGVASARAFRRDAIGTLQGRLMLLTLLVAIPGVVDLLKSGQPFTGSESSAGDAGLGTLVLAELALALCFTIMLPVRIVRKVVVERADEPLGAHPSFLADLLSLQVIAVIVGSSVFLWAVFHVFHGWALASRFDASTLQVLLHWISANGQCIVAGAFVFAIVRRMLPLFSSVDQVERLQAVSLVLFLAAFPLFVLLPEVISALRPDWLGAVGSLGSRAWFALLPQLAIPEAIHAGRPVVAWCLGIFLVVAVLLALRSLLGWRSTALRELDLAGLGSSRVGPASRSSGFRGGPRILRQLHAFRDKDGVPGSGGSLSATHGPVMLVWVLAFAPLARTADPGLLTGSIGLDEAALLIASVAWVSMRLSLGVLGRERRALSLLRCAMSARRIFAIKTTLTAVGIFAHTAPYAALTVLAGQFLDSTGSLVQVGTLWLGTATLFCGLGSALGFLLPDFLARSVLLPGATRSAQILFGTVAAGLVATWIAESGQTPAPDVASTGVDRRLALIAALILLTSGIVAVWGIRRTERMDV